LLLSLLSLLLLFDFDSPFNCRLSELSEGGDVLFSAVGQLPLASGTEPSRHEVVFGCNVVVGSFSRLSVVSGG
jgi:hypothetical protein